MHKNKWNDLMLARQFKTILPVLTLLGITTSAWSAQPLDAGRLLREQPKILPTLPGTPQQIIPAQPADEKSAEAGPVILVNGFRITGATLVPVEELQDQIKSVIGRELTFLELRAVAEGLIAYYAQKGYLAKAIVPPQDVENGIILIEIIEGERGSLNINNSGKRAKNDRVKGFVDHRLSEGQPMNLSALGEAVNLLNEQPGVEVKSTLKPGAESGRTDLIMTVADKPLATFNAALSNNGSRGTGEAQVITGVALQNPTGMFDQAALLFTKTEGSKFLMGDYSLAVGNSGLRMGVSSSRMLYKVTQDSLSASEAHGTATTFGINTNYPIYRQTEYALTFTGNLDTKKLEDYTVAGNTGDRRVNTATLGFSGKRQDNLGGGGETGFSLAYVRGHSDENNQAAIATDRASRDALGSFSKVKYTLVRQQKMTGTLSLEANMRGQFAFDNLDSSERFSLGGSDGVRAYPTGEGGGDDGWLVSLNLVQQFSGTLQGTLFLDAGGLRVNHNTWAGWDAGNPSLDNRYTLKGVGVSMDWKLSDHLALTGTLATPIGNNPGRDANGKDSDGRDQDVRAWINLVGEF